MQKRIYRSRKEEMIAGVCGGLGEYFDIDPVIMRLIFVLLIFAGGAGLIGYVIAWIIIPQAPLESQGTPATQVISETPATTSPEDSEAAKKEKRALFAGLILITVGLLFLFSRIFRWFEFWELWPVILIIIGFLIVLRAKRERNENPASA